MAFTIKDAGYLRYANVGWGGGGNGRRKRKHRKDQGDLDGQQQFLAEKGAGRMERRRGEEEEMEIEMEGKQRIRRGGGWMDGGCDACVSKCTQHVAW